MTSRDFACWLMGYIEINSAHPQRSTEGLTPNQVKMIQNHLALVFIHEIDPSMGDQSHQDELNSVHHAPLEVAQEQPPTISRPLFSPPVRRTRI